jgi:hypothetical protein
MRYWDWSNGKSAERDMMSNWLTQREQIFPNHRSSRTMGPGVEIKEDPIERRRRSGREMDAYTSLE